MRAFLVATIAAALVNIVYGDCDACIDGNCLRKQDFFPRHLLGRPDIDRNNNILYVKTEVGGNPYITQCNLITETCSNTTNTWYLSEFTVDQRTGDVYATNFWKNGIYKVDLVKNERVLLVDEQVARLKFQDKLYYLALRNDGIFTFEDGISRIVPCTQEYKVLDFIVDFKGDIYFEDYNHGTPLIRKLMKGADNATEFCDQHRLSLDKEGNAMFISLSSYTVYRVTNDQLVEVGAVTDLVYRPLFDGANNLIYAGIYGYENYYLKQVPDVQCSTERSVFGNRRVITEIVRTTTQPIESTEIFTYTTPAHETSNSTDDSNTSDDGQQKANQTEPNQESHQDQTCTCKSPKLPTVTVKIEFN